MKKKYIIIVGFLGVFIISFLSISTNNMTISPLYMNSVLVRIFPIITKENERMMTSFQEGDERDFIEAILKGRSSKAIGIAKRLPEGVNTVGADGTTALLVAVSKGDIITTKALLEAGADPNGGPDRAPLHEAVRERRGTQLTQILLDTGADTNKTYKGESAIHEAALLGKIDHTALLLRYGADVEKLNTIGQPPAFHAAAVNRWEEVLFLLNNGASVWTVSKSGFSIAGYAHSTRIIPSTENGKALAEVIKIIKAENFPWPPPSPTEMRKLMEEGNWPPKK